MFLESCMKTIRKLNDEEVNILNRIIKITQNNRVRKRAHAVLLSYHKYPLERISNIFEVHRETVRHWIISWERMGLQGLYDSPRPGRPRMVNIRYHEHLAG